MTISDVAMHTVASTAITSIAVNMKVFAIIIILCFGIAKTQSEEESFYFDYEPQSAEARYYRKKYINAEFL